MEGKEKYELSGRTYCYEYKLSTGATFAYHDSSLAQCRQEKDNWIDKIRQSNCHHDLIDWREKNQEFSKYYSVKKTPRKLIKNSRVHFTVINGYAIIRHANWGGDGENYSNRILKNNLKKVGLQMYPDSDDRVGYIVVSCERVWQRSSHTYNGEKEVVFLSS